MSFVNPYFIVGDKEEEASTLGATITSTVGSTVTEVTFRPPLTLVSEFEQWASSTSSSSTTSTTTPASTFTPTLICLCPTDLLPEKTASEDNNGGSADLFWMLLSLMAPILIGLFNGFVSSAYERMVRNKLRDEDNNETSK